MTAALLSRREPTSDDARRIVELACLAPSVHNTQPWIWHLEHGRVQLYADLSRLLPVEDPSGRNLTISCGAALHHFRTAAGALGWYADVDRLPSAHHRALLADIQLRWKGVPAAAATDLAALHDRCTDRRRFTSWPVPEERLERLAAIAREHEILATPVVDVASRFRLELAVHRAIAVREDDPAATAEQEQWTDHGPHDGVPRAVIPAKPASHGRRSRFSGGLVEDTRPDVDGSDGLIVLGSPGDDLSDWLRTGEGLSALWLQATRGGLSVVPLSQPIEVEETRLEVQEAVLLGAMVPHMVVRIGWQAISRRELPRTPRRPLADVLSG